MALSSWDWSSSVVAACAVAGMASGEAASVPARIAARATREVSVMCLPCILLLRMTRVKARSSCLKVCVH